MVVFDIEGRFAHFRKFYTNSSSLSYSIPPRTTVEGIIGAILGYERDSYYKILSSEKLHISVKKNNPTRSITQTLNYIKATSSTQLCAPEEHTQIPFEIIAGWGEESVSYRVYAVSKESYMDELIDRLADGRYVYPPSLGTAFFQGYITNVPCVDINSQESDGYVSIDSVVPLHCIEEIEIGDYHLIKEKMPKDFGENREIKRAETYIFDQRGYPVKFKIKNHYHSVKLEDREEKIIFM
ncbi:MAG: type I-B CRISPR-associated protein Cas5 [Clostridiaceae bacterium]|nr:type I-B CRISPR-associated protein Cas5 [Clostridiaceae bacterium]